jgi:hypothetical protein
MEDAVETQAPPNEGQIAFISGPIEPTEDYFLDHYAPLIDLAIAKGHSFIMGPAPGMDTMARHYLIEKGVLPTRITVYLAEFQGRLMVEEKESIQALGINVKVEGLTTTVRDAAMTRDSHYDILRYMSIQEQMAFYGSRYYPRVSATEKNERRRKGLPLDSHPAFGENQASEKQEKMQKTQWLWKWRRDT